MRHTFSVSVRPSAWRGFLLALLLAAAIAPVARADDWVTPPAPLAELSQVQTAETGHVLIFTKTAAFRHTEAINQGTPLLRAAFETAGITSEHTEDSAIFNDVDLARFDALVMFQTSGDPWTAAEKAALERYQEAGGGIVAIHNASDMRGNYQWWDDLIGSLMPGHAATGTSPGQPGEVIVEDQVHPSTTHLDDRWARSDEWYNFSTNVRGGAHVLATMDETTYDPGGNAMGYDHPISWCKPYDGGRAWVTAMGHFGAHYSEPDLVQHIVGGVKWAAGMEPGDCGGTRTDSFEKVALDQNTSAPFALDVAPDGRVFYTELVRGQIRVWDPETGNVKTAVTLDVYSGGEDGLLGIGLDPSFATNGYVYVYWSPDSENNSDPANFKSRVSRFTVDANSDIDPQSEELIIEVPASREPDEPGHTGGNLDFDLDGNLLLSVGDDVNPHSEPSGGYAPLSERPGTFHDARATSANTNDLRGKLLRVTPGADGGYTIPEGNLFPEAADTENKTLPEIYAMGFRNPFRFTVDPNTGWIGLADYAPDSGQENPANRGPAGIVEWNLIKQPGNYGWPLCIGPNIPYRDVDYTTNPVTVGNNFDCDDPVNDSVRNTGLTNLPPVQQPDMYYGYTRSSVPAVIPAGGGLAPMGGPFYDFDPDLESDVKFPEYFDGKPFFYEWSKNQVYSMTLDDTGKLEKIWRFLPNQSFLSPQSMQFGPDGALYVLEWGGGFGRDNPDSGIYKIDYISGSRSPVAVATATPDNGQEPLQVMFSSAGSSDPEGGALTYAWDFDGDGTTDSTEPSPTHTYTATGTYQARLTVADPDGKDGTTVVPVTVGNTKPTVDFNGPVNGGFIDWGDQVSWDVDVTDPEDGTIDYDDLIVQPALGHDAHNHPTVEYRGKTGSVTTDLGGGHSEDMKVYFILGARYTDHGDGDVPALTGSQEVVLQPKHKEAEHADARQGTDTADASGDPEGGVSALTGLAEGDWAAYAPVNFTGTDSITFRVASTQAGGAIELRKDSPTGELLGTAEVPATGSLQRWGDVTVDAPDSTETMSLYLVFKGAASFRLNFWEVNGKGISPNTRPQVRITAPTENQALDPGANTLTAEASDAENTISKVEFFIDGEKVGEDTEAPYSITWNETEEARYTVHAVATNSLGLTSDSRRVPFTLGEGGIQFPWETFANVDAQFDALGNSFTVSAAGADLWQGTNDYGAVYLPGGAPENFIATVKVAAFDGTHPNSKAGIIVRNDITDDEDSPGYMVVSQMGDGRTEFMHDAGGNGQVNNDGEPVTYGCPGEEPSWLQVRKFGTAFSVFCSKNGTEWTQVGATTTIPSAAAVQDIGLFVMSHVASTRATAEFTDWAIDTDPDTPGDEFDDPPGCAGAMSDEFDGPLSSARWPVVRGAGGMLPATSGGSLVAPVTNGDINEASPGPISYVGQPVPSGDWEISTKVTMTHDNEWQHAALAQLVDDDSYVKFALTQNDGGNRFFEFMTETGGTRTWHGANVNVAADFPTTFYMRLARTGSMLAAAYSTDGSAWTTLPGTATLKTGGTVGLWAGGDTDAQNQNAAFDWFHVTPNSAGQDPGPDDQFDGTALDGCRWDRIHHYRQSRLRVADGKLSIDTFNADISGANNQPIENLILQTPPAGDWTVETKMTAPVGDNWQLAGLLLYGDDDHYVKYDVVADSATARRVELRYEDGGSLTGPGGQDPAPPAGDTWWLRLTKTGDTYTGAIGADGETWVQNPGSVSVALEDPAIGVIATGPEQASPITVDFDHFRVVEEAENSAPVIGSAAADPVSGFAPLVVDLGVEATDADEDELTYSWDFDGDGEADSTVQNPTHTYAEPGEYEAEVTVSDGEASDTATVPVTVLEPDDADARFRVLVFSKTAGFRHSSIDEGHAALEQLGSQHDFQVDHTEDASVFRGDVLGEFDTVVFLSTTGDVLNAEQQAAFEAYVQDGGGYTGIHSASDTEYDWNWYGELVGAYFRNHPANQTATVHVEDDEHPSTAELPDSYARFDEWYNFKSPDFATVGGADYSPRENVHVLARVDESTYNESDDNATDDDHPVTWCQRYDGGRSWYTAMGHTEASFTEANFLTQVLGGLETTAGVAQSASCGVSEEPGAPVVRGFADPSSGAAPLLVRFSATALDPDGGPVSYRWSVEGVGAVVGRNFSHTFTAAGEYSATVTVTDDEGDTASDEVTVTVGGASNQAPSVDATAEVSSGAAPLAVRFHAVGNDPDGPEADLRYAWDFGDGGASFEREPSHTYLEPGTYTATVTVDDAGGASGTDTVQITVSDPPGNRPPSVEAGVLPGSGPAPLEVLLTSAGTDPDGDALTYSWAFGDGAAAASGRSVRHTYTAAGTYTAVVTASDGRGGSDTAEVAVVVGNPPANQAPTVQAAADPGSGAAPLTVRFSSAARDPDGDALLTVWSFGDGGQAGGPSATHLYGAPGTYTATVTVTDPDGATGSDTVEVVVGGPQGLGAVTPAAEVEVAGEFAGVKRLRGHGVRVTVACEATATGTARLTVSKATAKRLGLARRTVASRAVRCVAGREVSVRLRPSGSVARRLAGSKRVQATLTATVGGERVSSVVVLRRRV